MSAPKMINIGRDPTEVYWMYKMPMLRTKFEGSTGFRTVIPNMADVAKALNIHPAYPTRFIGIELGAQSRYDVERGCALINGRHQADDLAVILDRFIQQFLLCPNCKLPELKMSIKKSVGIKNKCAACGHSSVIESGHKLVGFMQRNPPKVLVKREAQRKERKEETADERAAHKARRAEKKAAGGGSDSNSSDDAADAMPAAAATSASAVPAASQPAAEKPKEKSLKKDAEDDDQVESEEDADLDENEWQMVSWKDLGLDAVEKCGEEKTRATPADNVLDSPADNVLDSPATMLRIFLMSSRTPGDIAAELRRLGMARELNERQKWKTLLKAIIDITSPKTVVEQFKAKADLLKYFARQPSALSSSSGGAASPNESNKNSGTMLLTCIEDLIGVVERKLLPAAPKILEALYDAEVLDEPTLVAWYDAPPEASWLVNKDVAAEVRAKARPFIDWLRTADEEDDE